MKIINKEKIDEKLYMLETEMGLKVYYVPKEGYTKKYAIFATNYGSIDNMFIPINEDQVLEVPEGIAHFLEHKLFESPDNNLFEEFSKLGADVNAYTNFNQTAYLFSTTENFYDSLRLLINFVQNPNISDESVEKEKGIIGQEIDMYRDNPGWRVYFNTLKAMYKNHPVRIDIAGTNDSIQGITRDLLYKAYDSFYNPKNMVLFVIGDLDFDMVSKVVNESERKDYVETSQVTRYFKEEENGVNEKVVMEEMLTSNPIFYIGIKDNKLGLKGRDQVKKDIVTNIVLDVLLGNSSEFYNNLYEEGLIDSSFGTYYTGKESYGHSLIVGESEDPQEVNRRIRALFKDKDASLLPEGDFMRIKQKEMGDFIMGLNSIEFIGNNFVDLYFSDFQLLDYLDLLEEISYQDILDRFYEHFNEDNMVLSIINPLENSN